MSNTTKSIRNSADINDDLRQTPLDQTRLYLQSVAVDRAITRAAEDVAASFACQYVPHDADVNGVAGDIAHRANETRDLDTFARLNALKAILESNPLLPAAKAKLEPLYAELGEAVNAESEARRLLGLERMKLAEAKEKAIADAVAAVEKKFSV